MVPPEKPLGLSIEERVISWESSQSKSQIYYKIFQKEDGYEWFEVADNLQATWFILSDMKLGVLYSFKVKAVNEAGSS